MNRPRKYSKTKAVKAIARERVGIPKPSHIVEDKTQRDKPKHKKKVLEQD